MNVPVQMVMAEANNKVEIERFLTCDFYISNHKYVTAWHYKEVIQGKLKVGAQDDEIYFGVATCVMVWMEFMVPICLCCITNHVSFNRVD